MNSLLILRSPNEKGKDVRWNGTSRRGDQPADGKHRQSHRGALPLVRPVVQVRVEHSIPDNGGLPGSARLHVISRPGIEGGGASDQNQAHGLQETTPLSLWQLRSSAYFWQAFTPGPPKEHNNRPARELSPLVFIIHSQFRPPSPLLTHTISRGESETKNRTRRNKKNCFISTNFSSHIPFWVIKQ